MTRQRLVSEEQKLAFARDGVVCLRQAIDGDMVERLRAAVDNLIANPGEFKADQTGTEGFNRDLFNWRREPAIRMLSHDTDLPHLVRDLADAETIRLFYDFMLVKEPGTAVPTPWHQDYPYYPIQGTTVCSTWVALDKVDLSNGAVEFIRGSHLWDRKFNPKSFASGEDEAREGFESQPDIEANRDQFDIISFDVEPGDAIVHHVLTLHGAPANASPRRRRAIAVRWLYGPVTFDPRPNTAVMHQKYAFQAGLAPGDQLAGDAYPLVAQ